MYMSLPFHEKRNVDVGMAVVVLFGVPIIAAFLLILGYLSAEEQIDGVTTTLLSQKVATFQLPYLQGQGRNKLQAPWVIGLDSQREVRIGSLSASRILVELVSSRDRAQEKGVRFELEGSWNDTVKSRAIFYTDPARKFIFLPAGQAHYIFSTSNKTLRLVQKLPAIALRRVVSMDDMLLLIGRNTLTALSTKTWQNFGSITF